jgi:GNAT superfamily N-acetyltransferase
MHEPTAPPVAAPATAPSSGGSLVTLRLVAFDDPLVAPLLAGLTREYLDRYGSAEGMADTHPTDFDPPRGAFLVALDADGRTVAGGGLRPVDERTCEVKRMWTAPTHRRQGLAVRVLGALEGIARESGYARLILETGPAQPEAAAMYVRLGLVPIPVYGRYPLALAFERDLTT